MNKWRLEPGSAPDASGLVEPAQPIVFYIDRTVPEEYRPYMAAGVEEWNRAFEAAGFKNAIRAEPLPDGADAEDLRYATLRWNVSDQVGYGAIGPSIVDPRTGEQGWVPNGWERRAVDELNRRAGHQRWQIDDTRPFPQHNPRG